MQFIVIAEADHGAVSLPSLECVEEARDVAAQSGHFVQVLLAGATLTAMAEVLAAHGADEVTLIEHEALSHGGAEHWLSLFEPVMRDAVTGIEADSAGEPSLCILAPDSSHMRAWLPRLALRLRIPLVSHCLQVHISANRLVFVRPTHGGNRHEQVICPGAHVVCATLAAGARGIGVADTRRRARVRRLTPDLSIETFHERRLRTLPPDPRTVDLREADRIVAGGLGVGGPAGVELLWKLGTRLEAAVGGTRVIADRGWLPTDRFIGTTGKTVTPKLYLALGISGASQHTSGMNRSETVIVVNNDRTAPLFSLADLGIVGDLHEIIPALLACLEEEQTV
ncbi:MAG: electron transfer flavoprotein subunit alpha/FixB family protein [Chloroflexales bacterium]|jgi:electron transfer flavoprotein alpha subunit